MACKHKKRLALKHPMIQVGSAELLSGAKVAFEVDICADCGVLRASGIRPVEEPKKEAEAL